MILAQNLTKTFGELKAVNDVSFDVAQGEIFAFLGPNGAGKTTTIKMLTTLLKPTSGKVEIDGLDPTMHQNEARKRFGIVFQDPSLDEELTAWENMDIHGALYKVPRQDPARSAPKQLLKLFELWERRNDPVKQFSGGMKRRLEIARGLLHTPKVLVSRRADPGARSANPQSALDATSRSSTKTERVTVFLTTHYMEEAERVAQRIAIIDHGRIVAQGSPQELKQQTGAETLGAGVPGTDRLLHSRRGRDLGGSDAQHGENVAREALMNAIYILWLRQLKRYVRSRSAHCRVAGPAAIVPAGARIRIRPDFSDERGREITFSFWRRA